MAGDRVGDGADAQAIIEQIERDDVQTVDFRFTDLRGRWQHYGFAAIPTCSRQANAAWQMISVLTLNLVRSFQIHVGAARRGRSWKRTFDYVLPSLQTLRFELIHQPARLLRPAGRAQLRFAAAPAARRRIREVEQRLKRVA